MTREEPSGDPALLAWLDRRPLLVCALVFAAFVATRSVGLSQDPYWLDEAWTVSLTHGSAARVLRASVQDQNPPAYNLLVLPWTRAFGRSEIAVRSLSVLAAALTAVALFLLARRFFSLEAALWATALLLTSSMAFQYASEARSYALVGLLCVTSYALYLRLFERPAVTTAVLLGVVNAAAVYAHYTVAFAFLAQLATAWLLARSRRGLVFYLASQVLAAALFAPWLPAMLRNVPEPGVFWLPSPSARALPNALWFLSGGKWTLVLGLATITVAAVAIARGAKPRFDPRRVVAIAAWAFLSPVVCFVVAQWTPVFYPRYLLFIVPALVLFAALAIASLPVGFRWRAGVAGAFVVAGLIGLDSGRIPKPDWRDMTRRARKASTASSVILVAPASQCLPFTYYFAPERFGPMSGMRERVERVGVLCGDEDRMLERAFGEAPRDRVVTIEASRSRAEAIARAAAKHGYRKVDPKKRRGVTFTVYDR